MWLLAIHTTQNSKSLDKYKIVYPCEIHGLFMAPEEGIMRNSAKKPHITWQNSLLHLFYTISSFIRSCIFICHIVQKLHTLNLSLSNKVCTVP
jgi:hypothetical protein